MRMLVKSFYHFAGVGVFVLMVRLWSIQYLFQEFTGAESNVTNNRVVEPKEYKENQQSSVVEKVITTDDKSGRASRAPKPEDGESWKKVERTRVYVEDGKHQKDHRNAVQVTTEKYHDPVFHPNFWKAIIEYDDSRTFVKTGDITDMWIRDSSAQMWNCIESTDQRTWGLVIRVLNMQAYYIIQDPYANSYSEKWRDPSTMRRRARKRNQGKWVATFNYELDSGAYFVRLLYHMWRRHPTLVNLKGAYEQTIQKWLTMIAIEQEHETKSTYRYKELPRAGKGREVKVTGMTWSCYRPSDDRCTHGYNVPGNLFAAMALRWISELYDGIRPNLVKVADRLYQNITDAVAKYGVYEKGGKTLYCYEVDGNGGCNKMDDANIPSLLSLPYLDVDGLTYDKTVYKNTRDWILSSENPQYFVGKVLKGVGSPHTRVNNVWPMSLLIQGFTSTSSQEQGEVYDMVVKSMHGGQAVHESVDVDNPYRWTRAWFAWADVLFKEYQLKIVPVLRGNDGNRQ